MGVRSGAGRIPRPGAADAARRAMAVTDGVSTASRPKRTFGVEAMAGRAKADYQAAGLRFDEILPGNYDGAAHVADMELDGIDVSVVYPAQAIFTYHGARSWPRDRVHALVQRLAAGRLPAGAIRSASSACRCCRSRTAWTSCIAELDRVLAKGAQGRLHPWQPRPPVPRSVLRAALGGRRASAGVPLTYHRTFGGRPQEADWDNVATEQFHRRRHRAPLPVIDAAADVPGLQRGLRALPDAAARRRLRSISAGCRSGRR